MCAGNGQLRARLSRARLYLVADAPGLARLLPATVEGGVDVVQLRDKRLADDALLAAARRLVAECSRAGAVAIVNDRPDIALAADADGVHLGQDDDAPGRARELLGPGPLIGVSTHDPDQIAAAESDPAVDYYAVGPVHETPTKLGRAAVGLGLVAHAAARARKPFFAIGGIDADRAGEVLGAGAGRIAVVRAIADQADPVAAARRLRAVLESADLVSRDGAVV